MSSQPTILLVNPPIYDFAAYDLFTKPLGLLYIAALLQWLGYKVRLVDSLDRRDESLARQFGPSRVKANGTGKYHGQPLAPPPCLAEVPRYYHRYGLPADLMAQRLESEYREHRPRAVLVSSMMTYWYPAVADTIALLRRCCPGTPIALGGVYATLMPDHAMKVCRPDEVLSGPGIPNVLNWLSQVTAEEVQPLPKGHFIHWLMPAYELYERLDYLTLLTSVGCPFHCDYCASSVLQPRLEQIHPDIFIQQLTEQLALLERHNKPPYSIALMDDALLAHAQKHIVPILQQVLARKLPVQFYCPNGLHVRFIDQEIAELMRATGFSMIRLSYECSDATPQWQRASDGKVNDREFRHAVDCLSHAGFGPGEIEAYILTGLPGQKLQEMRESARAVHDLGVRVRMSQFTPIPGTALFDPSCREYGIHPDEPLTHNNSVLPFLNPQIPYEMFQGFKNEIKQMNEKLDRQNMETECERPDNS